MADGTINRAVTVRVGIDASPSAAGLSRLRQGVQATSAQVRREFTGMGRSIDQLSQPLTRVETRSARLGNNIRTSLSRANRAVTDHSASLSQLGGTFAKVGAGAALGLAAVGAAAVQWESDFAGVRKTINDTEAGYQELDGQLRNLAKTLPATHTEIAGVAEAAGQLGVARKDLVAFTKTAIDLGESTNLSADQAATGLAQLMSVLGESYSNVSNVGSALVRLGNNGASTEAQILDLAQRFSGVAKQTKLTSAETLAYGSAISSLGINVEAGGTAISKVFTKIDQSVRNGGTGLETLARVSGKTTEEFANDFRGNAADAVSEFVTGLGKLTAKGGNVRQVLTDIGTKGQYESDVLLRLAGATKAAGNANDVLANSLEDGRKGYSENIALLQEAEKRYGTTASQAKIAFNTIKDSAIGVGQDVLPVIADLASGAAGIAKAFDSLPGPVKSASVDLLASVAILGLVGGGALKVVGSVGQAKLAMEALGLSSRAAGIALKGAALSIPILGVALFAVTEIMSRYAKKEGDASERASTFAQAISTMTGELNRNTAALNGNVRAAAAKNLLDAGAFAAADRLGLSYATVTSAALGQKDAIDIVNATLKENLALNPQLSKDNSDRRNTAILLSNALNAVSKAEQQAINDANAVTQATEGKTAASEELAQVQADLTSADQQLTAAQKELKAKTDAVTRSFTVLNQGYIDSQTAADNLRSAQLDLADSVKENGKSLDGNSRKGIANRQTIRENITAINDKITADFKNGLTQENTSKKIDTASKSLRQQREDLIRAATKAGFNRSEVKKMVDQMLLTPKELKTKVDAPGVKSATENVKGLKGKIDDLRDKKIEIEAQIKLQQDAAMQKAVATFRQGERDSYADGGKVSGYADGGRIRGVGGPRQDNIMGIDPKTGRQTSNVSVGEFVVNAAAYQRNQRVVEAINAGVDFAGFAQGGRVERNITVQGLTPNTDFGAIGGSMSAATALALSQASAYAKAFGARYAALVNKLLAEAPIGGKGFADALRFARSQDGKPYIWAAAGPAGYDCSGFMGAIQNVIEGKNPYSRRWSTLAFQGQQSVKGFTKNKRSPFMIGLTNVGVGHTAGTLQGVNVESSGGRGVHLGAGARGWNDSLFPMHYGYATGGQVGNPPFDLVDPKGRAYNPKAEAILAAILNASEPKARLASGGIVRHRPGGIRAVIGEGNHDEAVVPLPHGWGNYANGGRVTMAGMMVGSYAAGGAVSGVDLAKLFRLIIAQTTAPLKVLARLTDAVASAEKRLQQVARAGRAPQARVDRANRAVERGKDRIADQADRVRRLAKAAAKTKGETKADRDEDRARKRLAELRAEQTKLNREKEKAAKANARYDAAETKAKEKLKDANQALKDQQQQLADQAKQASQGFQDMYRSASTDARDWLDRMREGAGDLTKFRDKIDQLRKQGLSNDLIEQIIAQGATAGAETANSILGNKSLIAELNKSNSQLVGAANLLGYSQVTQAIPGKGIKGMVPSIPTFGTTAGLNAAAIQIAPTIYVQNPVTGRYLLAQFQTVADGRIAANAKQVKYAYADKG